MPKTKRSNLTKKDISKDIYSNIGYSSLFIEKVTDDLIEILKKIIKTNNLNVKNFANFKVISKKERVGRNPKNKVEYKIPARKSIKFIVSKKLTENIND
tara:strand:+ start:569 stop:865 length:297 start_codon:yes stop_codon:yes gene_type:complete